jgi:hypothetical protein
MIEQSGRRIAILATFLALSDLFSVNFLYMPLHLAITGKRRCTLSATKDGSRTAGRLSPVDLLGGHFIYISRRKF